MLLLDTNVISEPIKLEPNPAVRDWLDEKAAETLYISSVQLPKRYSASALSRRC